MNNYNVAVFRFLNLRFYQYCLHSLAEDLTSARMKLKPTTDAYNPPSTSTTTTITTTTATTPSYHDSSKKSDSPSAYPIYTKSSYRDLDEQSDTQTTSESSNSHKSSNKRGQLSLKSIEDK